MSQLGNEDVTSEAPRPLAVRHVVAAVMGNALEFYDFTIYATFSIQIGHAFFPQLGEYISTTLSLLIFAAGFVMRPIGGFVIGSYGDRAGRKPAMLLSFGMMGTSIIAMSFIPSYAAIGWWAPALALIARGTQGFALGGEIGPTTAYLFEAAPVHRRGLFASFQASSQSIASLAGGAMGFGLAHVLDHAMLDTYGWRIAFLVGGLTLPFGLMLRRSLPETLHEKDHAPAHRPLEEGVSVFVTHRRPILFGLMVFAAGTVATYTLSFLTTYAQSTLHMVASTSFAATLVVGLAGVVAATSGGWLSDVVGRKPVMIYPRIVFLLAIYPLFLLIVQGDNASALLWGTAGLSILGNLGSAAIYAALAEVLPREIRGRSFSVIYSSAITIFGGSTQSMLYFLIHTTNDPMMPAWYLTGFTALGVAGVLLIAETAPSRRKELAAAAA